MSFDLEFTTSFLREVDEYADYIVEESGFPNRAAKWIRELLGECDGLRQFPDKQPLLEGDESPYQARYFTFHSHRVIFEIRDDRVTILALWHMARLHRAPSDLTDR